MNGCKNGSRPPASDENPHGRARERRLAVRGAGGRSDLRCVRAPSAVKRPRSSSIFNAWRHAHSSRLTVALLKRLCFRSLSGLLPGFWLAVGRWKDGIYLYRKVMGFTVFPLRRRPFSGPPSVVRYERSNLGKHSGGSFGVEAGHVSNVGLMTALPGVRQTHSVLCARGGEWRFCFCNG